MEGTDKPDYAQCVDIVTKTAQREMILPSLIPIVVTVIVGVLSVKALVGRARPTLEPAAASLGPSFPSGHSATAAAFYAAVALVLGRRLAQRRRQILVSFAVGLAVAVAASRVLLDLHWLSDVVGGLALGWAWFALAAVVFGGRLLIPTAATDIAAAEAAAGDPPPTTPSTMRPSPDSRPARR